MKTCNWIVMPLVALALTACGGGGGGSGTQVVGTDTGSGNGTGTGGGSGTGAVSAPTVTLQLLDSADRPLAAPSLSQTEVRKLKITLKDAKGAVQAFKRVTVTLDNVLAALLPQSGTQLTGADGVAWFTIAPASVTASGAVTASANATLDGTEVSQTLDLQIEPGNVVLSGLRVAPTPVQLGQSVNVSAQVNVNGAPAASNSVTVGFSTGCGTVSPASVPVDANGRASAVIQTTLPGSCTISATAAGVSVPVTAGFSVTAAPITGIQFVSAAPTVIYQQDSVGVNSSLVKFKVIDSNGNPVAGQTVNADLINGTGGLRFCDSSASGNMAVSAATSGEVSFSICAGAQPETVQVRATLATAAGIHTDSNILTVQTGLPTQRFFDIAANRLNFYAGGLFTSKFNNDGVNITVNLADRQGNPVPNGTPVTLVTEGGQINSSNVSSCLISNGACTVRLIGQEYRPLGASVGDPRPGRVTVLAMADGEESFIDANNNNRYDPGELFEDLGVPFIDKNEDGQFSAAYRNLVVGTNEGEVSYPIAPAALGTLACPGNSNVGLSGAGTCNGVWNGSGTKPDGSRYTPTKVRRSIVIVFSGGEIGLPNAQSTRFPACSHSVAASTALAGDGYYIDPVSGRPVIPSIHHTELTACGNQGITVRLADRDGNPLPADASIEVGVRKPEGSQCAATLNGANIGNSIEPTSHTALLEKCSGIGEWIDFKVAVGSGASTKTSVFSVQVPPPVTP